MTDYKEFLARQRRLCLLRVLAEVNGTANDSVLHTTLEAFGFRRHARDVIHDDIRFLKANGLVTDEWVRSVLIVHITKRGVDVAEGREEVEGIEKPSIGV